MSQRDEAFAAVIRDYFPDPGSLFIGEEEERDDSDLLADILAVAARLLVPIEETCDSCAQEFDDEKPVVLHRACALRRVPPGLTAEKLRYAASEMRAQGWAQSVALALEFDAAASFLDTQETPR